MNRGLLLFVLAPTGLAIAGATLAESASAGRTEDAITSPGVRGTAGLESGHETHEELGWMSDDDAVGAQHTPLGLGADVDLGGEATPFSDCDPSEVRRYCAYRSRCRVEETPAAYKCMKGDTFVARIPKTKSDLVPQCRSLRARIRKICEPRR